MIEEPGLVLLESGRFDSRQGRYSFLCCRPFLTFRARGSQCHLIEPKKGRSRLYFCNPWRILDELMARYELLDEIDLPFPLGGCFGFWGYELNQFVEPRLPGRARRDLDWPDCHLGFYSSLVAFDRLLGKTFVISTGLEADGSRSESIAEGENRFWKSRLEPTGPSAPGPAWGAAPMNAIEPTTGGALGRDPWNGADIPPVRVPPGLLAGQSKESFIKAVAAAQQYIRAGDIYQVNLSHRLNAEQRGTSWEFYLRLAEQSPAPFAAFIDCGDFQIASSSPERFLRLSGAHAQTRPIKGTRPRSSDSQRDARLAYELQTSPKERAELLMITDLLRNDLGRVCEFGSVQVPELMRLERFAQVQHLVSTVEGVLRPEMSHARALAACFPGGSVTGAPKIRAMQIIDELEPVARGPYTGAIGYLGFNRESQLSITIRTALCVPGQIHFQTGAGIVADSEPEAEYKETMDKAAGFLAALASGRRAHQTHG